VTTKWVGVREERRIRKLPHRSPGVKFLGASLGSERRTVLRLLSSCVGEDRATAPVQLTCHGEVSFGKQRQRHEDNISIVVGAETK
jgi:hypothetical protein